MKPIKWRIIPWEGSKFELDEKAKERYKTLPLYTVVLAAMEASEDYVIEFQWPEGMNRGELYTQLNGIAAKFPYKLSIRFLVDKGLIQIKRGWKREPTVKAVNVGAE